jgi:hypothetical protein
MTTIKSYTDIEQSRKLAEILPIESADMFWLVIGNIPRIHVLTESLNNYSKWESYPCWSLTGLLNVLPDGTDVIKDKSDTKNEKYMCTVGVTDDIISTFGNNPVDACYEMILKLNESKLL